MSNSEIFVLPSLWEDPGFVLIEAAYCRSNLLSSNCHSGPIEFMENGKCGFIFEKNNLNDFMKKFNNFLKSSDKQKEQKKINALRSVRKFTIFNHFKKLNQILQ